MVTFGQFGTFPRRLQELLQVVFEELRRPCPERSSRMNVKPPEAPTPGMAGGVIENEMPSGSALSLRVQHAHDSSAGYVLLGLALVPGLQLDEEEARVRVLHAAQEIDADDAGVDLDRRAPA